MRTLTTQEKRTVRLATIGIGIYLVLFFGFRGWTQLQKKRAEYITMTKTADKLKSELQLYEDKALAAKRMMESFRFDPAKLTRKTVVGEASAAIQRAAASGGMQLGPIRESPSGPSSKELASMQLEGFGPIAAAMTFLHKLESLGYPLIVDSLQISQGGGGGGAGPAMGPGMGPGMIKLNLTIVILDFEQWKSEEAPRA